MTIKTSKPHTILLRENSSADNAYENLKSLTHNYWIYFTLILFFQLALLVVTIHSKPRVLFDRKACVSAIVNLYLFDGTTFSAHLIIYIYLIFRFLCSTTVCGFWMFYDYSKKCAVLARRRILLNINKNRVRNFLQDFTCLRRIRE